MLRMVWPCTAFESFSLHTEVQDVYPSHLAVDMERIHAVDMKLSLPCDDYFEKADSLWHEKAQTAVVKLAAGPLRGWGFAQVCSK